MFLWFNFGALESMGEMIDESCIELTSIKKIQKKEKIPNSCMPKYLINKIVIRKLPKLTID